MSQRRRQLLLVLLAAVLLLSAAAPVAANPPAPGPGGTPAPVPIPSTPEPAPTPEPMPGATPAPNGTNATGGSGGLFSMDPVAFVTDAFVGLAEGIANGVYAFFGGITWAIFGIPAVGTLSDPTTWADVDGPFWPVIRNLHLILSGVALLILGIMSMHTLGEYHGRELQKQLAEIGLSVLMVVLGWWVVQFQLHLANTITLAFAPDPTTLFATPGNATKFGLTLVVGAIGLLLSAGAMAMAAFVVIAEKVILVLLAGLWPIFWAFRPAGGYSDTVAGLGLGTFYGVLGANVLQGILAWVLWNIDWAGIHATEAVGALIGQLVGTGITFVGIPLIVGRNFVPEAMIMFGKPAVDIADDFSDSARQQAQNAAAGYAGSVRSKDTHTSNSAPAASRGGSTAASTDNTSLRHDRHTTSRPAANDRPRPTRPPTRRDGRRDTGGQDDPGPQSTRSNRHQRQRRRPGSRRR